MCTRILNWILLAATLLALSATSATASTLVVDQQNGPYMSISAASALAQPGDVIDVHAGTYPENVGLAQDDITLSGRPGATLHPVAPWAGLSITGRRVTVEGLTLTSEGDGPGIDVRGDGAVIRDTSVLTSKTAVQIMDAVTARIDRSVLHATGPQGPALVVTNGSAQTQHTTVTSSLLIGGSGIHAVEYAITAAPAGALLLDIVFSTLHADPGWGGFTIPAQGEQGLVSIKIYNSIAHTTYDLASQPGGDGTDLTGSDEGTFVDPAGGDFHLRTDAPVLGRAVALPPGIEWPQTDLAGLPRHPGTASPGAYELPNRPPSATLVAGAGSVRQGTSVRLDASGSGDPDPAGKIVEYAWSFGDGTPGVTTTTPTVDHVYAGTGRAAATVRVTDQFGAAATSAPATIETTDGIAPALRVTAPRAGGRHHQLRRSGKRRVINVLKLAGSVRDDGGVARVDVTLRRGKVKHSGRAVVGRGGALAWHSPAKARLARGRWTLTVVATDRAGNASRAVLHFRVT